MTVLTTNLNAFDVKGKGQREMLCPLPVVRSPNTCRSSTLSVPSSVLVIRVESGSSQSERRFRESSQQLHQSSECCHLQAPHHRGGTLVHSPEGTKQSEGKRAVGKGAACVKRRGPRISTCVDCGACGRGGARGS